MYFPVELKLWPPSAARPPGLLSRLRQRAAYWQRVQQFDARTRHLTGLPLVAAILEHLAIQIDFDPAELRHLPTSGAFLALADQPGSLLHSLVVLHVLGPARPELCAVLAETPLLAQLAASLPLLPAPTAAERGGLGFRRLLRRLHHEVPLAVFATGPAEATYLPAAGRLLTTLRLPVVPLWLQSQPRSPRAWWAQLPALLHHTSSLPGELLSQRGTTVRVRLGPPVLPAVLHGLPQAARLPFLHTQLAALVPDTAAGAGPGPPVLSADYLLLEADLAALPAKRRLVQCRQWEVYVARGRELPHLLPEINRLRELTLRQGAAGRPVAGEPNPEAGYRYLLLYDRRARRLVGACRLGHGRRILRQQGRKGFGLHAVCKLKRELRPVLRQSLELSQAFIRVEYQGQMLPLGLVWQGLAQYLSSRPHYRYLLSELNLSHHLLPLPPAALLGFVQQHCLADEVAAYVQPRKPERSRGLAAVAPPVARFDREQVLQALLASPALGGMGVPARLRPYFGQQARLLGVHLDPAGSGALHGAILLDATTLGNYTYRLAERSATPPAS